MLSLAAIPILMMPHFDFDRDEAPKTAADPETVSEEPESSTIEAESFPATDRYSALQMTLAYVYGHELKAIDNNFRAMGLSLAASILYRRQYLGYSFDLNIDPLWTSSRTIHASDPFYITRVRTRITEFGIYLSGHTFAPLIPQKLLFNLSLGLGLSSFFGSPYPYSDSNFYSPALKGGLSLSYKLAHNWDAHFAFNVFMRFPYGDEVYKSGQGSQQYLLKPGFGFTYLFL